MSRFTVTKRARDGQRGTSLTGALGATALVGLVAAGLANYWGGAATSLRSMALGEQRDVVRRNVRILLDNPAACLETMNTIGFPAPGSAGLGTQTDLEIKDASGATYLKKDMVMNGLKFEAVTANVGTSAKGDFLVHVQTRARKGGAATLYTDDFYANVAALNGGADRCLYGTTASRQLVRRKPFFITAPDVVGANDYLMLATADADSNPPSFGPTVSVATTAGTVSATIPFRHTQDLKAQGNEWVVTMYSDVQGVTRGTTSPTGTAYALPNNQTFMPFPYTCAWTLLDIKDTVTSAWVAYGLPTTFSCNAWSGTHGMAYVLKNLKPGRTYTFRPRLSRALYDLSVTDAMVSTMGMAVTVEEYLSFE